MANRILAALTEKPGDYSAIGWRHSVEIQRSAAGQPGLLITASRQYEDEQEEEITVVVEDGLAFLAPVLKWLLTPEVIEEITRERFEALDAAHAAWVRSTQEMLDALIAVGQKRAG